MPTWLNSLLGVAANGALIGGMVAGGWGLAAGVIVSSVVTFCTQVFGGSASSGLDTYLQVTGKQIDDAVSELKTAVQLDFTTLELSELSAAQDWFAANLDSCINGSFDPSIADLNAKISEIELAAIQPALKAMAFSRLQIDSQQDTSLSTLGLYSVAAVLVLNSCKLQLTLRRIEDAKNVVAKRATALQDVEDYPEYTNLVDYLHGVAGPSGTRSQGIIGYLETQVAVINKAFLDLHSQLLAIPQAASQDDQLPTGQKRLATYMNSLSSAVTIGGKTVAQPQPMSVYTAPAIDLLTKTLTSLQQAGKDYEALAN